MKAENWPRGGSERRASLVLRCCFGLLLASWAGQGRAQWVEPPGSGWLQVSVYHHNTRSRFDERGHVVGIFNEGGQSITTSLFATVVHSITRGADVWLEVPLHWLQFNDVVADRSSTGLGDPRIHVRAGPALFGVHTFPVPVALRLGAKLPLGDFPIDSEIIPLTEGQRDYEVILELGHSFYPRPFYAMGWVGYRWRERNEEVARKPGDERFFFVAVGGGVGRFTWKVAADGLFGRTPRLLGIPIVSARRRLVQLLPSAGWRVGPGVVELGARLPVVGRNLPAGPALFLGYFIRWGR